eukprot:GHVN01044005.1.p2 GENE.GHVN01044005.1~~GHVN01044005.1.p2  ORF type:complete len:175 (-),score=33.16 GHVN01044005.1:782-1306(-)
MVGETTSKALQPLNRLAELAAEAPQEALALLTRSFQHQWSFARLVNHLTAADLQPIECTVAGKTMPNILGADSTREDRPLLSLPARCGGMGICNLTTNTKESFTTSIETTNHPQPATKGEAEHKKGTHISQTAASRTKMRVFNAAHHRLVIEEALAFLPPLQKRVIERTTEGHS